MLCNWNLEGTGYALAANNTTTNSAIALIYILLCVCCATRPNTREERERFVGAFSIGIYFFCFVVGLGCDVYFIAA